MRVGYSRTLAGLIFSFAVITLVGQLMSREVNTWALLGGCSGILLSAAYAYRPYFELRSGEIVVFAPLSPATKRYRFTPGTLIVRKGRIRLQGRDLPIRKLYADKAQWAAVVQAAGSDVFA